MTGQSEGLKRANDYSQLLIDNALATGDGAAAVKIMEMRVKYNLEAVTGTGLPAFLRHV